MKIAKAQGLEIRDEIRARDDGLFQHECYVKGKFYEAQHKETADEQDEQEFGTLSKTDIVIIAVAVKHHIDVLKNMGIDKFVVDEQTLMRIIHTNKGGMPELDPRTEKKEVEKLIYSRRLQALEKLEKMFNCADLNQIFKQIHEKSSDVWKLVSSLFELRNINATDSAHIETYHGIVSFLKHLFTNSMQQTWAFDNNEEPESMPIVSMSTENSIPEQSDLPRFQNIEDCDPEFITHANHCLSQVSETLQGHRTITPETILSLFPQLDKDSINHAVNQRYIRARARKPSSYMRNSRQEYGVLDIAIMLYVHEYLSGINFTSKVKKQIQEIFQCEFQKMIRENNTPVLT
ncbi:MAG: hypothetical protein M1289_02960 [Patescibacteria group bacterium]|nr:hypothetical protein [Patescibacteria group bacterium]